MSEAQGLISSTFSAINPNAWWEGAPNLNPFNLAQWGANAYPVGRQVRQLLQECAGTFANHDFANQIAASGLAQKGKAFLDHFAPFATDYPFLETIGVNIGLGMAAKVFREWDLAYLTGRESAATECLYFGDNCKGDFNYEGVALGVLSERLTPLSRYFDPQQQVSALRSELKDAIKLKKDATTDQDGIIGMIESYFELNDQLGKKISALSEAKGQAEKLGQHLDAISFTLKDWQDRYLKILPKLSPEFTFSDSAKTKPPVKSGADSGSKAAEAPKSVAPSAKRGVGFALEQNTEAVIDTESTKPKGILKPAAAPPDTGFAGMPTQEYYRREVRKGLEELTESFFAKAQSVVDALKNNPGDAEVSDDELKAALMDKAQITDKVLLDYLVDAFKSDTKFALPEGGGVSALMKDMLLQIRDRAERELRTIAEQAKQQGADLHMTLDQFEKALQHERGGNIIDFDGSHVDGRLASYIAGMLLKIDSPDQPITIDHLKTVKELGELDAMTTDLLWTNTLLVNQANRIAQVSAQREAEIIRLSKLQTEGTEIDCKLGEARREMDQLTKEALIKPERDYNDAKGWDPESAMAKMKQIKDALKKAEEEQPRFSAAKLANWAQNVFALRRVSDFVNDQIEYQQKRSELQNF